MAADWVFHWLTQPLGLALIMLAMALPFGLWRAVLGKAGSSVGYMPLVAAYASAMVGLASVSFVSSYVEFSSRVAKGVLREAERWPTVLGWSIYFSVLSLLFVLPLIGLVGVPFSALLMRLRRFTYVSIAVGATLFWLSLAILLWAFPSNEWHQTHRFESLVMWLRNLLPGMLFIALPFLLAIHRTSGTFRRAGT